MSEMRKITASEHGDPLSTHPITGYYFSSVTSPEQVSIMEKESDWMQFPETQLDTVW